MFFFFPWQNQDVDRSQEAALPSAQTRNIRLPVSAGRGLSGSWQREIQCCARAATPLSLQKKKNIEQKRAALDQTDLPIGRVTGIVQHFGRELV